MSQNPDAVEWHICENFGAVSIPAGHQAIHMGPFATEEECRATLASLQQNPCFRHGALEVQKKSRRREKRIRMKLRVEVCRLSAAEEIWPAHTVDISSLGARLADCGEILKLGEILEIRCDQRAAVFRVAWIGLPGTPTQGHLGVECLSPETNIWDLGLSARTDDEPLLQEITIARAVQRNLLPRETPALRTLEYSGKCIQARTVGGDYYDFLDMGPGRVGFVLADVAGKGVAAALLMANLHGSIHSRGGIGSRNLPALLTSMNDHLYKYTESDRYATLFFGCYDDESRSLGYVNCGHSPPLLLRGHGAVERLAATATVLGLFGNWECSVAETRMEPGDVLSIFTDGITETTGATGEEFGEDRLLGVLQEHRDLAAATILSNVEQAVEQYRSSENLQDDLTLVVARGR
jgi:Stage II sporulation protein E (SpoIIE)/PilZ domain